MTQRGHVAHTGSTGSALQSREGAQGPGLLFTLLQYCSGAAALGNACTYQATTQATSLSAPATPPSPLPFPEGQQERASVVHLPSGAAGGPPWESLPRWPAQQDPRLPLSAPGKLNDPPHLVNAIL